MAAATPWSQVEAEAVSGGASSTKTPANNSDGEGEGEAKVCASCRFNHIIASFLGVKNQTLNVFLGSL